MHSKEDFLSLKKRLIESQMIILDYQMRDIEQEIAEFEKSKDTRKWDDISKEKLAEKEE